MMFTNIRLNFLLVVLAGLIFPLQVRAHDAAATLEYLHGTVMIDHGDGYTIANADDAIYPGDHVLVMEESTARIVSGHCVLPLKSNSLRIIGRQGACEAEYLADRQVGPLYAAAIGVIKPKTESEPEEIEKPPETAPPGTTEQKKVVKQTPNEKPAPAATAATISPKAIAIGAGIAAALAALGGGGGGGNASTPSH